MMKTISIVVPCFNEEQMIPIFYNIVTPILRDMGMPYEILFIDDGSSDATPIVVRTIIAKDQQISLISFSRNFGKEAALLAGLEHAVGDAVIVMDVDLQDPPELLPDLVQGWRDGYETVYTRRINRDGEPLIRSWFARRFYDIINKCSDITIVDGARDYRIMSRRVVDSILQLQERNRFCKGLFMWVGFSAKCIEYENVSRAAGVSTWSFRKLFNYAIEGIISFSTAPLRIATYVGLMLGSLSFVYMLFTIIKTFIDGNPVAGYPSLVSIILFSTGVQLTFLGIIGEYLSRMFTELKSRPHYFVKEYSKSNLTERKSTTSAAGIQDTI